jgi:hypothetical protein
VCRWCATTAYSNSNTYRLTVGQLSDFGTPHIQAPRVRNVFTTGSPLPVNFTRPSSPLSHAPISPVAPLPSPPRPRAVRRPRPMDLIKVRQYSRPAIANIWAYKRIRWQESPRKELLHAAGFVPKSSGSKEPRTGRQTMRVRYARTVAARAHHCQLAANLHRQGIRPALGRGRRSQLVDFKAIEYKRKGYAVATDVQLARIAEIPKREFIRRGINQHTLEKICTKKPVRAAKLAECLKVLEALWLPGRSY